MTRASATLARSGLVILLAFATATATATTAAEDEAAVEDRPLPPAARDSIDLGDPPPPEARETYPGLPELDPFELDPDAAREALQARVRQALDEAPEVAPERILIHVTARHAVRLNGTVSSGDESLAAEVIAAGVPGVTSVDNLLVVEADAD